MDNAPPPPASASISRLIWVAIAVVAIGLVLIVWVYPHLLPALQTISPQPAGGTPPANASGSGDSGANPPPSGPPTASDEQAWASITQARVQSACLSQAKAQARASGYGDWVVFSCSCSAQESEQEKDYACSVAAADGQHPVGVQCSRPAHSCTISSQQGTGTYSFEQLQQMG